LRQATCPVSSREAQFRFARDSPLERTGFELAVPPRRRDGQCYGVRSLKRRLDRRGMTSRTARNGLRFQLVLLRKPFLGGVLFRRHAPRGSPHSPPGHNAPAFRRGVRSGRKRDPRSLGTAVGAIADDEARTFRWQCSVGPIAPLPGHYMRLDLPLNRARRGPGGSLNFLGGQEG
jgi:hypothetical protein